MQAMGLGMVFTHDVIRFPTTTVSRQAVRLVTKYGGEGYSRGTETNGWLVGKEVGMAIASSNAKLRVKKDKL